jgi:hypothetical protein
MTTLPACPQLRQEIEKTLSPAIDCRAPYAKVMIAALMEIAQRSRHPLIAEIERLMVWVADLQSGMYVNCVYCGHRYGPCETTPVSMADALKRHIAECPAHPMSELIKALTAASHALKSYAYGNASPDLAKSVSQAADAALAKARAP